MLLAPVPDLSSHSSWDVIHSLVGIVIILSALHLKLQVKNNFSSKSLSFDTNYIARIFFYRKGQHYYLNSDSECC